MTSTPAKIIGVMGGSECDTVTYNLAYETGRLIAAKGAHLLCGGRTGVMEAACKGAKTAGGLTIGILPGTHAQESPPNPYVDIPIFTGIGYARNWINISSSDGIIALAGSYGTLSEIAVALSQQKPLVLLRSWALDVPAPRAETPAEAVEKLVALL
ncbi:MAG: TIGR00725 family protein [Gemmatimonadetes bacterium]|nr:MAG: TIGR00725 family protein [Gemmatimonadota bacterium]